MYDVPVVLELPFRSFPGRFGLNLLRRTYLRESSLFTQVVVLS